MKYYGDNIPDMTQIYPEGMRSFDKDICPDGCYEDENGYWNLPEIEEDLPF